MKPDTDSITFGTSIPELQARLDAGPFNSWLGLRMVSIDANLVHFTVPWRPEFIGTPRLQRMHGGVLAALVDAAAGYTLMARIGTSITTVDIRTDYHQGAGVGDLTLEGAVVKLGRKLACVDVRVYTGLKLLAASGRGTFYIATPSQP